MDLDFTSVSIKPEELRSKLKRSLHNKTVYGVDFKIIEQIMKELDKCI